MLCVCTFLSIHSFIFFFLELKQIDNAVVETAESTSVSSDSEKASQESATSTPDIGNSKGRDEQPIDSIEQFVEDKPAPQDTEPPRPEDIPLPESPEPRMVTPISRSSASPSPVDDNLSGTPVQSRGSVNICDSQLSPRVLADEGGDKDLPQPDQEKISVSR